MHWCLVIVVESVSYFCFFFVVVVFILFSCVIWNFPSFAYGTSLRRLRTCLGSRCLYVLIPYDQTGYSPFRGSRGNIFQSTLVLFVDNLAFFFSFSSHMVWQRAFFFYLFPFTIDPNTNCFLMSDCLQKSSSPLFSRINKSCTCYSSRHCALFETLHEEYHAALIKTSYWIPRVMNVHCRLVEVNAASAATEHLSYLKGN